MKRTFLKSASAIALACAGAPAFAQTIESGSFSAGIVGGLQGDTGFMTTGTVTVNGIGTGSVTLARTNASIDVNTGASNKGVVLGAGGQFNEAPEANAFMNTTFDFDRAVNTTAALVGRGSVNVQGDSMGRTGVTGSAFSSAEVSGTRQVTQNPGDPDSVETQVFTAEADTNAAGSLVGSFLTRNILNLQGQTDQFAASQSLDLRERNIGRSAGQTGNVVGGEEIKLTGLDLGLGTGIVSVTGDGNTEYATLVERAGFLINDLDIPDGTVIRGAQLDSNVFDLRDLVLEPGETLAFRLSGQGVGFGTDLAAISGSGAGFGMLSIVPDGAQEIVIDVASAGGGSVTVSGSTGGFFGEGTTFAAEGNSDGSDIGGFFSERNPNP